MPDTVPTAVLAMTGQSIWVDNITRDMLRGQLQEYIARWSVVGLTSNPTIFAKAIAGSRDYDAQVAELAARGMDEEAIFFELALSDLGRACEMFLPTFARTGGVDGWCSLEVSLKVKSSTRVFSPMISSVVSAVTSVIWIVVVWVFWPRSAMPSGSVMPALRV